MLPNLNEIKFKRKQFSLTQSELAFQSGVSQSLIAKTESGKLTPTYDKAKRIFDTLEAMHEQSTLTAKNLMNKKIVSIKSNETIKKAIQLMEKNSVSQLPVIENDVSLGTVSEKTILNRIGESSKNLNVNKTEVKEIMQEAMPTIREETPFKLLVDLLNYNETVLIAKKGKIIGIISKSDLLHLMLKK